MRTAMGWRTTPWNPRKARISRNAGCAVEVGCPPPPRWPIVWDSPGPSRVAGYRNKIASTRFCFALDSPGPSQDALRSRWRGGSEKIKSDSRAPIEPSNHGLSSLDPAPNFPPSTRWWNVFGLSISRQGRSKIVYSRFCCCTQQPLMAERQPIRSVIGLKGDERQEPYFARSASP